MGITNFPDGISDAGEVTVRGTVTITGATAEIVTGLSSIAGCVPGLGEAPGASSGDVYSATWAEKEEEPGTLVLSIWQDGSEAATEDTTVSYIAWGEE